MHSVKQDETRPLGRGIMVGTRPSRFLPCWRAAGLPPQQEKKKRMNLTVHADMVDCNSCGLFFEEMFYLFCFVLIICLFL